MMNVTFRCKECKLKFSSPSMESIIKCNKKCNKCLVFFTTKPPDTPLNLPEHNISNSDEHKTCKRCGVIVKSNIGICPVCSCVEFIE